MAKKCNPSGGKTAGRLRVRGRFASAKDIREGVTFSWDGITSIEDGKPQKFTVLREADDARVQPSPV